MVMTEVHLYKRTDGGKFKNSMGSSEESGYGNLVKKCQALITLPHSKSFLAGLLDWFLTILKSTNSKKNLSAILSWLSMSPFLPTKPKLVFNYISLFWNKFLEQL